MSSIPFGFNSDYYNSLKNKLVQLEPNFAKFLQTPVIAQNRFTQAPTVIGNSPDTNASDTGLTSPEGLSFGDKVNLTLGAIARHLGYGSTGGMPTGKGAIFLSPDLQAMRHETVHSVLNNQGVTDSVYSKALEGNRDLEEAFNKSNLAGDVSRELPAYMVEYANTGNAPIPGITPEQRDNYLSNLSGLMNDSARKQFQRLYPQ